MNLPHPPTFTAAVFSLFALSGLGNLATAATEVRIGIGLSKPPYIMATGQSGLEYDIVDKALEAGGYTMVAQAFPPARALALLRAGHLDGMVTVTEGVGGPGYFSDNYIAYQNVAITLTKRAIELGQVQDLARYSVAAFQNASMILNPEFAAVVAAHPDYKEYPQQVTQNKLLYSGRVDVVIGDRLIFRHLTRDVAEGIDAGQAITIHPLFPPTPRKAVFRDAAVRDAFNAGLRTIHKNGTYAAILDKYRAYLAP
jgi:polar amino acid transport system substrate-binding protein